jgi:hypothetical protein
VLHHTSVQHQLNILSLLEAAAAGVIMVGAAAVQVVCVLPLVFL